MDGLQDMKLEASRLVPCSRHCQRFLCTNFAFFRFAEGFPSIALLRRTVGGMIWMRRYRLRHDSYSLFLVP